MKYLIIALLGIGTVFGKGIHIVQPEDMTHESLEEFFKGKRDDLALMFKEGSVLPLKLSLEGEYLQLLSAEYAPVSFKVLKTCFVRIVGEEFYYSSNGKDWKDFSAFFTGKIGASLEVNDRKPIAGVVLELNHRKG